MSAFGGDESPIFVDTRIALNTQILSNFVIDENLNNLKEKEVLSNITVLKDLNEKSNEDYLEKNEKKEKLNSILERNADKFNLVEDSKNLEVDKECNKNIYFSQY